MAIGPSHWTIEWHFGVTTGQWWSLTDRHLRGAKPEAKGGTKGGRDTPLRGKKSSVSGFVAAGLLRSGTWARPGLLASSRQFLAGLERGNGWCDLGVRNQLKTNSLHASPAKGQDHCSKLHPASWVALRNLSGDAPTLNSLTKRDCWRCSWFESISTKIN